MFFPWCGHPGTASLARQSAAKSGRFSPDGKTGHGTSGAADERHPGPPQAASPANSPSTRFTAQPASEGTIAHHSIQCSATAPVSSSTFAVDDTPSVWISREPSTTCSAPLARGWPCMRSWNHEHLHYLQRRVPDMGKRDGVDRRRNCPCRTAVGSSRERIGSLQRLTSTRWNSPEPRWPPPRTWIGPAMRRHCAHEHWTAIRGWRHPSTTACGRPGNSPGAEAHHELDGHFVDTRRHAIRPGNP